MLFSSPVRVADAISGARARAPTRALSLVALRCVVRVEAAPPNILAGAHLLLLLDHMGACGSKAQSDAVHAPDKLAALEPSSLDPKIAAAKMAAAKRALNIDGELQQPACTMPSTCEEVVKLYDGDIKPVDDGCSSFRGCNTPDGIVAPSADQLMLLEKLITRLEALTNPTAGNIPAANFFE